MYLDNDSFWVIYILSMSYAGNNPPSNKSLSVNKARSYSVITTGRFVDMSGSRYTSRPIFVDRSAYNASVLLS